MSRLLAFDIELKKLIFLGTAITGLAENQVTTPLTSLYVSLATAQPVAPADQTSNEVTYTGYLRVAVPRSGAGWSVGTDGLIRPVAAILFPAPTAVTTEKATHILVGTAASGVGKALYSGILTQPITLVNGVVPRIEAETATLVLSAIVL